MFRVFTRTWWRDNPAWPNGLEPCPGRKRTIGFRASEQEAQELARAYNETHKPGRLSRKAEYEER
jgi:hypothetical protein